MFALASARAADELSLTLQRGLFEEEANHDLIAAIKAYETVVTATDAQRKLAGTALFRLAECYRKLGRTNEALARYQRVLREYADQTALVDLARQFVVTTAPAALGSDLGLERTRLLERTLTDAQSDAARLRVLHTQLTNLSRAELRKSLTTVAPDAILNTLLEQNAKSEQKIVELVHSFGPDHAEVKAARGVQETINRQIEERIDGVLAGLKLKLQAQEAQVARLKDQLDEAARSAAASLANPPATAPESNALAPTDEEEKEVRRIQALIKDSPDLINAGIDHGTTPLHQAAAKGQLVVARFLLANKANVNARRQYNMTPLHDAVMGGHKSMAELLLAQGADPNVVGYGEGTPLHSAAVRGYKAILEVLLANKADPNAVDSRNGTPLHTAVSKGYRSVAEALLNAGADVNIVNKITEQNPSQYAHNVGTPLHIAAYDGNADLVELLLARHPDVQRRNQFGEMPIHFIGRQIQVARLLLAAKADINARITPAGAESVPDFGRTPLCSAVMNGQADLVQFLLKNGADPNVVYRDGPNGQDNTPLSAAIDRRDPDASIIRALLEGKAAPNALNERGYAPLHYAVFNSSKVAAELLLEHAANVDIRERDKGNTPLGFMAGGKDVIEVLLDHKANPNAQNNDGNTPLHKLVSKMFEQSPTSQKDLAELLIARGANVNLRNRQGLTPLNLFGVPAQPGHRVAVELADVLRKHGALDEQLDLEPDPDSIRVWRKGMTFGRVVFVRDTAGRNRFTLLETLVNLYNLHNTPPTLAPRPAVETTTVAPSRPLRNLSGSSPVQFGPGIVAPAPTVYAGAAMPAVMPAPTVYAGAAMPAVMPAMTLGSAYDPVNEFPFPDLTRIRILRLVDAAKNERKVITVSLLNAAGIVLCNNNTPLEFGDIIEIPAREYRLDESRIGLTSDQGRQLFECLPVTLQFVVKGEAAEVKLMPLTSMSYLASAMQQAPVRKVLRSSSDLSRVRVRRPAIAAVGQPASEMAVDLEAFRRSGKPADDLWLRDGDVVEVPEKEQ